MLAAWRMKTIQPQNWKTFHHSFKKDTKPHNQKLPGSDNLPCIHKIRNSCSGCDDDHELEQGFCTSKKKRIEFITIIEQHTKWGGGRMERSIQKCAPFHCLYRCIPKSNARSNGIWECDYDQEYPYSHILERRILHRRERMLYPFAIGDARRSWRGRGDWLRLLARRNTGETLLRRGDRLLPRGGGLITETTGGE
jgi:hypothetical protein